MLRKRTTWRRMLECALSKDNNEKKRKKKKPHPDTKEQSDERNGDSEEDKEHEEPGAPVQPVAEAHHPHVLLQARRKKSGVKIGKKKEKNNNNCFLYESNILWASSPSPGPRHAQCWGMCRWNWAPAGGAAGSEWPGWRHRTYRPGRGSATEPLWSSTARRLPRSCWASAWLLGPRRAARPGSPLGSSLRRADSWLAAQICCGCDLVMFISRGCSWRGKKKHDTFTVFSGI